MAAQTLNYSTNNGNYSVDYSFKILSELLSAKDVISVIFENTEIKNFRTDFDILNDTDNNCIELLYEEGSFLKLDKKAYYSQTFGTNDFITGGLCLNDGRHMKNKAIAYKFRD